MFEIKNVRDNYQRNISNYPESSRNNSVNTIWDVMARCSDDTFSDIINDFEQQYGIDLTEEQVYCFTQKPFIK